VDVRPDILDRLPRLDFRSQPIQTLMLRRDPVQG
jgi:hypothetical protein